jgi:hypothetical protein
VTGDQIEQRRFAGAVRTDQPMDGSRGDFHRNVADSDKAAEATRKPVDF